MKVFVDGKQIKDKYIEVTDPGDIKHITKALRMKVGEKLTVSDGMAFEYETVIAEMYDDLILLEIRKKQGFSKTATTRITIFQGIPKSDKMDLIVQKCVELGVDSIVPVFMDRTVVVDKGNFGKKIERYRKIAAEAAKQCRRNELPEVRDAIKFDQMISELGKYDLVVFPYENEDKSTIKDLLQTRVSKELCIIIGPEGGFSEKEAELIKAQDVRPVSLGHNILRTETAGIAAVAMVMYEYEL